MDCSRREFLKGMFAAGVATVAAGASFPLLAREKRGRAARTITIAHLTDPQFGWGSKYSTVAENYASDLAQFEKAIDMVNELQPDVAIITGDMTHEAASVGTDWPDLLEKFDSSIPVYVAPGNHDMGDTMTAANRDRYLDVFGYDRAAFAIKGWHFIVGNTQFLFNTALTDEKAEYEEWLADELENAKAYGGRVILAGHYPPFISSCSEADSYYNYPRSVRYDRLRMFREARANIYLAGHTHAYSRRGHDQMTILNAETTMYGSSCGFRLLEIYDDYEEIRWSYTQQKISLT